MNEWDICKLEVFLNFINQQHGAFLGNLVAVLRNYRDLHLGYIHNDRFQTSILGTYM